VNLIGTQYITHDYTLDNHWQYLTDLVEPTQTAVLDTIGIQNTVIRVILQGVINYEPW